MFEIWYVVCSYSESLLSQLFKTGLILDMCSIVYELHGVNGLPAQKYLGLFGLSYSAGKKCAISTHTT